MTRTLLIWLFIAGLLICPLRCGKGLRATASSAGYLRQHCCQSCHHHIPAKPVEEENDSFPDSHLPAPDSDCGCGSCVCKGAVFQPAWSPVTISDFDFPIELSFRNWNVSHFQAIGFLVADFHRSDNHAYGRGLRQSLQSWLI
jgi:hypothetical protein